MTAQEHALITRASQSARRVRRFMHRDALDNAGGDDAVEATRGHMIAFLSGYRLLTFLRFRCNFSASACYLNAVIEFQLESCSWKRKVAKYCPSGPVPSPMTTSLILGSLSDNDHGHIPINIIPERTRICRWRIGCNNRDILLATLLIPVVVAGCGARDTVSTGCQIASRNSPLLIDVDKPQCSSL
jgi:hypothetical protein